MTIVHIFPHFTGFLLLLLSGSSCNTDGVESSPLSRIQKKVIEIAKNENIPSLEVAIQTQQDVLHFAYHHPDVLQQELYGIGSTTKMLTALMFLSWVDDRIIDLSDSVHDFISLPAFLSISGIENLTISSLLNHTSGLTDYTHDPNWGTQVIQGQAPTSFEDKISLVEIAPEATGRFTYSNTNYVVLERIAENLTDQSFKKAFNSFYKGTGYAIRIGNDRGDLQAFYAKDEQASSDVSEWNEHYGYDGGAYTTSIELNRLIRDVFIDKSVLSEKSLAILQNWISMEDYTIKIGDGTINEYGMGLMKLIYKDEIFIGHLGSTLKYQSIVCINTVSLTSFALTLNASGPFYNRVLFQKILPAILDELTA